MPTLTDFDRDRIAQDIEQLAELITRKQVLWEAETDEKNKDRLANELTEHADQLAQLKTLLP